MVSWLNFELSYREKYKQVSIRREIILKNKERKREIIVWNMYWNQIYVELYIYVYMSMKVWVYTWHTCQRKFECTHDIHRQYCSNKIWISTQGTNVIDMKMVKQWQYQICLWPRSFKNVIFAIFYLWKN